MSRTSLPYSTIGLCVSAFATIDSRVPCRGGGVRGAPPRENLRAWAPVWSTPAEFGGDVRQDAFDDVRVVVDSKLVRHRQ